MGRIVRSLFVGLVSAAVLVAAVTSQAKTLEEILKEKGVITADEYAEATKANARVRYRPGKGVTVETADGNYSANLGGYAQLRYSYTDKDADSAADVSDFRIRRFKLVLKGNLVTKRLGYKFQGEMAGGFVTEDAFLTYSFGKPLMLQMGQFKPAQARQELTSAARQLFPDRSLANDTFNLGRDDGLQVSGRFAGDRVGYGVGIFNGNGPNTRNPSNRHMIACRIDVDPLGKTGMDEAGWPTDRPRVNFGGSFAGEKVGADDVGGSFNRDNDVLDVALELDKVNAATFTATYGGSLSWWLWTSNLGASWHGASFAAEYYRLQADPDLGSDWSADGYHIQAGYQVIPRTLELAARYSEVESTDANASARFDKSEIQFGVNYYFAGHDLKLQADVTQVQDDLGTGADDTIGRLQAQFFY